MKLPKIDTCDRVEFIMKYAKGKSVLHLGCAEAPFTEEHVEKGTLLHQRLSKVAGSLSGVDISEEGIEIMRRAGISDLYIADATKLLSEKIDQKFDVIVAGEILEHVTDVGFFLDSMKSVTHKDSFVVITTPHYASIKRIPRLLWRNEVVHPDHLYYFSYATLIKLFEIKAYDAIEWGVYWRDVGTISAMVNKPFRKIGFMQYFADGFCVSCRV